jgi:exodeoxyribonuclease VII large subunit
METEFPFVTVKGEISNLRTPFSGHSYFVLKDQSSQLKAVIFKGQQRYLEEEPENGRQVICRGRISVYEPRGEYQLIVDFIDFHGTGVLQLAFERLKNELAAAGLFAAEHKKQLPFLPAKICLITSPQGAAVHDFLKIAATRFPIPIEIMPVAVQGENAAAEIAQALEMINDQQRAEVIVICRGGGSIEDLWAFNEEKTARAIFASAIPVVTAIGHEIDFTIADYVADQRAATPTAAAEIVLPDRLALLHKLEITEKRLIRAVNQLLNDRQQQVKMYCRLLGDPSLLLDHFRLKIDNSQMVMTQSLNRELHLRQKQLTSLTGKLMAHNPAGHLSHQQQKIAELSRKLKLTMLMQLEKKRSRLTRTVTLLEAVNPLSVLGRGYALVRSDHDKKIISDSKQVRKGEKINILLNKGKLESEITKIIDN